MASGLRASVREVDPESFAESASRAIAGDGALQLSVGDEVCSLEGDLAEAIVALLRMALAGSPISLASLPADLTTGQAADILGVSRPTVVALVDSGRLPASRIGTHRRIPTVELLAYQQRARAERSAGIDRLAELSDELGLYDQ